MLKAAYSIISSYQSYLHNTKQIFFVLFWKDNILVA